MNKQRNHLQRRGKQSGQRITSIIVTAVLVLALPLFSAETKPKPKEDKAATETKTTPKGTEAPETSGTVVETKKVPTKASLTVKEAIELALENNLTIKETKFAILSLRPGFMRGFKKYAWTLDGGVNYQFSETPDVGSSQVFNGQDQTTRSFDTGISKKFHTGTTIRVGINHAGTETTSASTGTGLNATPDFTNSESYDSGVDFSVQQELLKNFFGRNDRLEDELRLSQTEGSKYEILNTLNAVALQAILNYWQVTVQELALETRQTQLDNSIFIRNVLLRKRRSGLAEQYEINQANAKVATAESDLAAAKQALLQARIDLISTMNLPEGTTLKGVTQPERDLPELPGFQEAYDLAIKNRYDLKKVEHDLRFSNLEKELAENNALPSVVLEGGITGKGASEHHAGGSMSDAGKFAFKDYRVGIRATYPLWDEEVKARKKEATFKHKAALAAGKRIKQDIRDSLKKSLGDIRAKHAVLTNALTALKESQAFYNNLTKEFRKGRFSVDLVTDANDQLVNAKLRAVQAEIDFNTALLQLDVETNTMFAKHGISIEKYLKRFEQQLDK